MPTITAKIQPPGFPTFNTPNWGAVTSGGYPAINASGLLSGGGDTLAILRGLADKGYLGGAAGDPGTPGSPGTPETTTTTPGKAGYWTNPDWEGLIQGDPTYMATLAQIEASGASAGRERAAAVRRAIAQFGGTPKGWASGFGDVDPATLAAAQENPYSTLAQLDKARGMGRADLGAALGARGMLSSGALTGGEQVIQKGYEQAQYEGTQKLLDALYGYESAYGQGIQNLKNQQLAALDAAGSRVLGRNPPTWTAETAATSITHPGTPPVPPVAATPPVPPPGAPPPFDYHSLYPQIAQPLPPSIYRALSPSSLLLGRLQRTGG
jgi:hypothetical protein